MRILFISDKPPINEPPGANGTAKRMETFINAFKQIAQLDLLFYMQPNAEFSTEESAHWEKILSQRWNTSVNLSLCPGFYLPRWRQRLDGIFSFTRQTYFINPSGTLQQQAFEHCLKRKPNIIFAQRLQCMIPLLRSPNQLPPVFFDLDDIEHLKLVRQLRQPPSRLITTLYYLQVPALLWGERQAIQAASSSFVCSEHDRRYLSQQWKLPNIKVIPNSITIPEIQPLTAEPNLLLLGTYTSLPNIQAANFLIEQVFPKIRQVIPTARLIIAGNSSQALKSYDQNVDGVEFTGFVENLDALYQRSRVVCCPIFVGGGTRVKMIEAAAYGKPIVASRIGAEGLELTPDNDYLLGNTAAEFADACVELLKNDSLCDFLSCNARATAIKYYDRKSIVRLIQQSITSTIES
jgi:glycosyltransferase involved in cell wall biosynthesis